ncbi:MAG: response regulator [Pseudorhodoplanes sp.]
MPGVPTRVLIVEDETVVSFLVEDMLLDIGCREVVHAADIGNALRLIESGVDFAVLDVNLGRENVYPVAERLAARGIAFLFASGYGRAGLEPAWRDCPVIQKPFRREALAEAMQTALRRAHRTA